MKRFIIAFSAFIVCFIGILAAMLAAVAFTVTKGDNYRYFFGGTAVVSFVISWLLLKISRQK
jgi:hypothetical protein